MDTTHDVGELDACCVEFRDADVRRLELATSQFSWAVNVRRCRNGKPPMHIGVREFDAERFTILAQALSKGDRALEDQILCLWGVR